MNFEKRETRFSKLNFAMGCISSYEEDNERKIYSSSPQEPYDGLVCNILLLGASESGKSTFFELRKP